MRTVPPLQASTQAQHSSNSHYFLFTVFMEAKSTPRVTWFFSFTKWVAGLVANVYTC